MKTSLLLALAVVGAVSIARGQMSQNIVGYINQAFYPGDNYIANQLANGDNTLDTIFQPGVPEGATFAPWDPVNHDYLPTSTYDVSTGWSINYTFGYGQGALFYDPQSLVTFTNTFVGSVWPGFVENQTFVPPVVTATGDQLLSCVIPIDASFYDVIGRDPLNGESVTMLDAVTQTYTTTTFENGVWNNGDPSLAVGESAMFDLLPVPEPGIYGLAAMGVVVLAGMRKRI